MNLYRGMNRLTGQWWEGEAESATQACNKAGWIIGDCWVRERTPVVADPAADSGHRGGGWKNVS